MHDFASSNRFPNSEEMGLPMYILKAKEIRPIASTVSSSYSSSAAQDPFYGVTTYFWTQALTQFAQTFW